MEFSRSDGMKKVKRPRFIFDPVKLMQSPVLVPLLASYKCMLNGIFLPFQAEQHAEMQTTLLVDYCLPGRCDACAAGEDTTQITNNKRALRKPA